MIIEVSLYKEPLGTVEWNEGKGCSTFQYSSGAIASGIEPSPLVMPLQERIFETSRDHINFHNLPYLISDSMPDDFGNTMMREWLRQRGISINDINPVDRLTYVGKRGMGALEYKPISYKENADYQIIISELLEVARAVLEGKENVSYDGLDKDSLADILRIGTSVGGARAKALIAIRSAANSSTQDIRPGDINQPEGFTYWLIKIDGANERTLGETSGMGKIEYAYYLLAQRAGIEMSQSFLHEENGRFHFVTKRFDRGDKGEKVHVQTLGALAGIDYRIPRASSYETLFRVMKRLRLPYYQFEQQYRRAIFNVIARNHDDHVKNFAFLMGNDGAWSISPAYDITFQFKAGGKWTNAHQSSINGKFDGFTRADLLALGKVFGIKKANRIVDEVLEAVNQWRILAMGLDIQKDVIEYINKNLRVSDFIST